jgi:type VI secretion system secreted protein Hcp
MALNAYLSLTGQKQGAIKGSVTQKGREDKILVIAFSHDLIVPRDPASGLPSGRRMHKAAVITKEVDKSTPPLYTALVQNENITQWELQFWRIAPNTTIAGEQQHYTVKLTNANIASIAQRMLNTKDANLAKFETYEEIAFTYQRIEWKWVETGVTSVDDWSSPY